MLKDDAGPARWPPSSPASGCTSTTSTQLDEKSEQALPTFAGLRGAMYEESIRFFTDLFQRDGSVLDVLDADYTFLNEPLAQHYGIPGVTGPEWRRVDGVQEVRPRRHPGPGDDAGQAVRRVADQPDPARQLGRRGAARREAAQAAEGRAAAARDEADTDGLTVRQLVEKHTQRSQSCATATSGSTRSASPSKASTPSAAAARRTWAAGRSTPRSSSTDGTEFDGLDGLRDYLLTTTPRRRSCASSAASCSATPWAGRSSSPTSRCSTRCKQRWRANDYRVSAAIETIVQSRQFREIRGEDSASPTEPS